ncbi:ABC transporter permease subunit, partial [Salmonella enterica subsp. enterica serovar Lubbock]|nr:ABC transporter permease subunit [Salmonella enterica subsp. enterica serovar Lubbock]
TLPDELVEAARIDGASPMRFFRDIVLPLSKTNLAALFVITFIAANAGGACGARQTSMTTIIAMRSARKTAASRSQRRSLPGIG